MFDPTRINVENRCLLAWFLIAKAAERKHGDEGRNDDGENRRHDMRREANVRGGKNGRTSQPDSARGHLLYIKRPHAPPASTSSLPSLSSHHSSCCFCFCQSSVLFFFWLPLHLHFTFPLCSLCLCDGGLLWSGAVFVALVHDVIA